MTEPAFRLFRENQQREDGLSASLQLAKAAEHLVCCELILQGHNAFLSDAGQPYDVVVDLGNRFFRVQVKSTARMYDRAGFYPIYRFAFRKSRTGDREITAESIDIFALVALDSRQVAFVPTAELVKPSGVVRMMLELKTRRITYTRRRGRSGLDPATSGKFIEDYAIFRTGGD